MKLLVIGSEGFIGSHCADFFSKAGYDIWQNDVIESSKANYILSDKKNTDFDAVFAQQHFDICINASGSANVDFSFKNPEIDFELNVLNVHKILVAIRKYNPTCKFINFSSAAVYGNPVTLPISENMPANPLSPYGFHKLQSEYLLTEYHKFFRLNTCSLRVFSAYGPRLKKQLFWDLYQKHLQPNEVVLFGTGNESRDFIYIDDLLQLINLVITKASFTGEIYNAANGVEVKISEAVKIFFDTFENKTYQFNGQARLGDPLNWRADISKIKALGFNPSYTIQSGLKKHIQWLKDLK